MPGVGLNFWRNLLSGVHCPRMLPEEFVAFSVCFLLLFSSLFSRCAFGISLDLLNISVSALVLSDILKKAQGGLS